MTTTDYSRAACRDVPTSVFFSTYTEPAKAVCATCPIKGACKRDHATERFGVWGGTDPQDRGFASATGQRCVSRSDTTDHIRAIVAMSSGWWTAQSVHDALPDGCTATYNTVRDLLRKMGLSGELEFVRDKGRRTLYRRTQPAAVAA